MKLNDEEFNDLSECEKASIDFVQKHDFPFEIGDTRSTIYVKWMAEVWEKNDKRNKMQ